MALVTDTPLAFDIHDPPPAYSRDELRRRYRFPFAVDEDAAKPWVLDIIDTYEYSEPPMVDGVPSLPPYDPKRSFIALFHPTFLPLVEFGWNRDGQADDETTQSDENERDGEDIQNNEENDDEKYEEVADEEDDVECEAGEEELEYEDDEQDDDDEKEDDEAEDDEDDEDDADETKVKLPPELQRLRNAVYYAALFTAVDYIRNGTITSEVFDIWSRQAFALPFIVIKLSALPRRTDILPTAHYDYARKMDQKDCLPGEYERPYMYRVHAIQARTRVSPLRNEVTFEEEDAEVHAANHDPVADPPARPTGTVTLNAYQLVDLELALVDNRFHEYRILVNKRRATTQVTADVHALRRAALKVQRWIAKARRSLKQAWFALGGTCSHR